MATLKQLVAASGPVLVFAGAAMGAGDSVPSVAQASSADTAAPVVVSGVHVIATGGLGALLPGTNQPLGPGLDAETVRRFQLNMPESRVIIIAGIRQ